MNSYSPFHNAKGNQLPLSKILFSHIRQLEDVDEGYNIEYKSEWNDNFKKKHLAKVITSFANTEGGWLFVGVDDAGKFVGIEKQRTDFSQQIGQILKTNVSPYPTFETKFVKEKGSNKGVLIVYVHEGDKPPYVCTGSVYVRIGSNKEPVPASNRGIIDNLTEKRNRYRDQMDKFCINEFYDESVTFPYASLYMYNTIKKTSDLAEIWFDREKTAEFAKKHGGLSWTITPESIVLFHSDIIQKNNVSATIEVFFDGSIKLFVPFLGVPDDVHEEFAELVSMKNDKIMLDDFTPLDGFWIYHSLKEMIGHALDIISELCQNKDGYQLKVCLENIKDAYIYYALERDAWADYVIENGLKLSRKASYESQYSPLFTKERTKNSQLHIEFLLAFHLFPAFGLLPEEYLHLNRDVLEHIQKLIGPVNSFSTIKYQKTLFGCVMPSVQR